MHVCFPASCISAKKRVLCICSSNMGHEALCIWSENENSASFALTTCTSKKLSVCRASGEWVIMDLSLKRANIWVFICLQGTLQPQTRCLQCGDTLEWSEEHGCVCLCVQHSETRETFFFFYSRIIGSDRSFFLKRVFRSIRDEDVIIRAAEKANV